MLSVYYFLPIFRAYYIAIMSRPVIANLCNGGNTQNNIYMDNGLETNLDRFTLPNN